MIIGKIVKSDSHVNYVCQIYASGEVASVPQPLDYPIGQFVRIRIRTENAESDSATWAIGVIYNTILLNPSFGTLGPRLSNEDQVEVFSPDYLTERAVLVYVLLLGVMDQQENHTVKVSHDLPPVALELGSEVETMHSDDVRAFHYFADSANSSKGQYLHMGYLPYMVSQGNSLMAQVALQIISQLEALFQQHGTLLSMVKHNFAWRMKVETTS